MEKNKTIYIKLPKCSDNMNNSLCTHCIPSINAINAMFRTYGKHWRTIDYSDYTQNKVKGHYKYDLKHDKTPYEKIYKYRYFYFSNRLDILHTSLDAQAKISPR